jgi:hypothetical protein
MYTTIKTRSHSEEFCPDCLAQLDTYGGISRLDEEYGEDIITRDMVTVRESNEDAGRCTWCGALRWLSERMIARLSPLRRANLERRLSERVEELEADAPYGDAYADGSDAIGPYSERLTRARAVLGRAMMLISNVESRERSERHG